MTMNHLDPCVVPTPETQKILDKIPGWCKREPMEPPSLKSVPGRPDVGWTEPPRIDKLGVGQSANADPMQAGRLRNDPANPDRNTLYRYAKGVRGFHEAMKDLFTGLEVIDEDGKAYPVPIMWGSQEKAVVVMLSDVYRKDNSNVVDRLRLPMMSIVSNGMTFDQDRYCYHMALDYMREFLPDSKPGFTNQERYVRDTVFGVARGLPYNISYTLYIWTKYEEDASQILEQVVLKFSPIAYIRIRGVGWEVGVKLDSIADNKDLEPGDKNLRVIKHEIQLTAETFIPQPIQRKKTVLKTRTDILDGLTDREASEVIARLEETVKELA